MKILTLHESDAHRDALAGRVEQLLPRCVSRAAGPADDIAALVNEFRPDAILLGYPALGPDWLKVCRAINGKPATSRIPIVAVATAPDPDCATNTRENRGDAFLIQSVTQSDLDAELRALVRPNRAEESLRAEKESLERAVAEHTAALRETKDYLENLLGYANAPIIVWDPDFKITRFNRAFERLTGRSSASVLGMELSFLFPPTTREHSLAHIRRASAGEYWETVEIPIQHTDGSVRLLLWNSAVVRSPDSERIIATIAQGHDITARKQAEEALRLSREQLRALSTHLQSLREAERTRIAREIHDELGQMLTGLKMDLHWAENRLEELPDPRLNPILDKLVAATEVADATITTVQRIASELRPGVLDRLGLMMALRHELDQFQQRTGIACELNVPEEEPGSSPAVATAFYRIFQETLTNVARHAAARTLRATFRSAEDWFILEVRDDGRGIEEAALASPHALGLLGMQERAHLLGGSVSFLRETTGGTTVTVRLPATQETPAGL